jgi:peptidyl-prolyl cis-trans isomerase D
MPDRKVADAAFALKPGEVTGPIQGELGLVVIKVADVTPAKTVTLPEVREKIENELKQDQAKEKIYEVVQKYDDAHSGGASMAEAAKAAGQTVVQLPPIASNGRSLDNGQAKLPPKILQTAFTLPAGGESDVIDLGQGEYWVVHVDKVFPPTLFALTDTYQGKPVREPIAKMYVDQQLESQLRTKAQAMAAELRAGKPIDAVAAEVKAKVVQASNVLRTAAQSSPAGPAAYSQDFLGAIFAAKPGAVVFGSVVGKPGFLVAKLLKVQEPSPEILAAYAERARRSSTGALSQDINNATRMAAVAKMKPTTDPKLARRALGVDADTDTPVPGKSRAR